MGSPGPSATRTRALCRALRPFHAARCCLQCPQAQLSAPISPPLTRPLCLRGALADTQPPGLLPARGEKQKMQWHAWSCICRAAVVRLGSNSVCRPRRLRMRLAGTPAAAPQDAAHEGRARLRRGGRLPEGRLIRRAPARPRRRICAPWRGLAAVLARARLQHAQHCNELPACLPACMEGLDDVSQGLSASRRQGRG